MYINIVIMRICKRIDVERIESMGLKEVKIDWKKLNKSLVSCSYYELIHPRKGIRLKKLVRLIRCI